MNGSQIAEPRLVTRNGTTYAMHTGGIGATGRINGNGSVAAPSIAAFSDDELWAEAKRRGLEVAADQDSEPDDEESQTVHNHRAQGTGENEWYTPPEPIEAARAVLGVIDLDPASSEIANRNVRAAKFFSQEDDGLTQPWHGQVWMNPPYAQPWIARFTEKLVAEYAAGNVSEAIALTHNYTDTAWFHHVAGACDAICFTRGRIGFLSPTGERAAPTQGQTFFYFGEHVERFAEAFCRLGLIVYTTR